MKKGLKGFIFLSIAVVCVVVGVLFIQKSMTEYSIFLFAVAFVLIVFGIGDLLYGNNPTKLFESKVKRILNTYDSILVKSTSVPRLDGKNIFLVETIDDLVDAQLEIRKPICYLKQTESCSFVLLDDQAAYVYVEKVNEEITSPIEIEIKESRIRGKNIDEMDAEMLREIERTTIVKLSNKKSYKVSPIRKKEELKDNSSQSVEGNGTPVTTTEQPVPTETVAPVEVPTSVETPAPVEVVETPAPVTQEVAPVEVAPTPEVVVEEKKVEEDNSQPFILNSSSLNKSVKKQKEELDDLEIL